MLRGLKKFNTQDEELSRSIQNIDDCFAPIVSKEILDGLLLSSIKLSTSITKVPHRLGRSIVGYIIVSQTGLAMVHSPASDSRPDLYLQLQASATCTVNLWVF